MIGRCNALFISRSLVRRSPAAVRHEERSASEKTAVVAGPSPSPRIEDAPHAGSTTVERSTISLEQKRALLGDLAYFRAAAAAPSAAPPSVFTFISPLQRMAILMADRPNYHHQEDDNDLPEVTSTKKEIFSGAISPSLRLQYRRTRYVLTLAKEWIERNHWRNTEANHMNNNNHHKDERGIKRGLNEEEMEREFREALLYELNHLTNGNQNNSNNNNNNNSSSPNNDFDVNSYTDSMANGEGKQNSLYGFMDTNFRNRSDNDNDYYLSRRSKQHLLSFCTAEIHRLLDSVEREMESSIRVLHAYYRMMAVPPSPLHGEGETRPSGATVSEAMKQLKYDVATGRVVFSTFCYPGPWERGPRGHHHHHSRHRSSSGDPRVGDSDPHSSSPSSFSRLNDETNPDYNKISFPLLEFLRVEVTKELLEQLWFEGVLFASAEEGEEAFSKGLEGGGNRMAEDEDVGVAVSAVMDRYIRVRERAEVELRQKEEEYYESLIQSYHINRTLERRSGTSVTAVLGGNDKDTPHTKEKQQQQEEKGYALNDEILPLSLVLYSLLLQRNSLRRSITVSGSIPPGNPLTHMLEQWGKLLLVLTTQRPPIERGEKDLKKPFRYVSCFPKDIRLIASYMLAQQEAQEGGGRSNQHETEESQKKVHLLYSLLEFIPDPTEGHTEKGPSSPRRNSLQQMKELILQMYSVNHRTLLPSVSPSSSPSSSSLSCDLTVAEGEPPLLVRYLENMLYYGILPRRTLSMVEYASLLKDVLSETSSSSTEPNSVNRSISSWMLSPSQVWRHTSSLQQKKFKKNNKSAMSHRLRCSLCFLSFQVIVKHNLTGSHFHLLEDIYVMSSITRQRLRWYYRSQEQKKRRRISRKSISLSREGEEEGEEEDEFVCLLTPLLLKVEYPQHAALLVSHVVLIAEAYLKLVEHTVSPPQPPYEIHHTTSTGKKKEKERGKTSNTDSVLFFIVSQELFLLLKEMHYLSYLSTSIIRRDGGGGGGNTPPSPNSLLAEVAVALLGTESVLEGKQEFFSTRFDDGTNTTTIHLQEEREGLAEALVYTIDEESKGCPTSSEKIETLKNCLFALIPTLSSHFISTLLLTWYPNQRGSSNSMDKSREEGDSPPPRSYPFPSLNGTGGALLKHLSWKDCFFLFHYVLPFSKAHQLLLRRILEHQDGRRSLMKMESHPSSSNTKLKSDIALLLENTTSLLSSPLILQQQQKRGGVSIGNAPTTPSDPLQNSNHNSHYNAKEYLLLLLFLQSEWKNTLQLYQLLSDHGHHSTNNNMNHNDDKNNANNSETVSQDNICLAAAPKVLFLLLSQKEELCKEEVQQLFLDALYYTVYYHRRHPPQRQSTAATGEREEEEEEDVSPYSNDRRRRQREATPASPSSLLVLSFIEETVQYTIRKGRWQAGLWMLECLWGVHQRHVASGLPSHPYHSFHSLLSYIYLQNTTITAASTPSASSSSNTTKDNPWRSPSLTRLFLLLQSLRSERVELVHSISATLRLLRKEQWRQASEVMLRYLSGEEEEEKEGVKGSSSELRHKKGSSIPMTIPEMTWRVLLLAKHQEEKKKSVKSNTTPSSASSSSSAETQTTIDALQRQWVLLQTNTTSSPPSSSDGGDVNEDNNRSTISETHASLLTTASTKTRVLPATLSYWYPTMKYALLRVVEEGEKAPKEKSTSGSDVVHRDPQDPFLRLLRQATELWIPGGREGMEEGEEEDPVASLEKIKGLSSRNAVSDEEERKKNESKSLLEVVRSKKIHKSYASKRAEHRLEYASLSNVLQTFYKTRQWEGALALAENYFSASSPDAPSTPFPFKAQQNASKNLVVSTLVHGGAPWELTLSYYYSLLYPPSSSSSSSVTYVPNAYAAVAVLEACAEGGRWETALQVLRQLLFSNQPHRAPRPSSSPRAPHRQHHHGLAVPPRALDVCLSILSQHAPSKVTLHFMQSYLLQSSYSSSSPTNALVVSSSANSMHAPTITKRLTSRDPRLFHSMLEVYANMGMEETVIQLFLQEVLLSPTSAVRGEKLQPLNKTLRLVQHCTERWKANQSFHHPQHPLPLHANKNRVLYEHSSPESTSLNTTNNNSSSNTSRMHSSSTVEYVSEVISSLEDNLPLKERFWSHVVCVLLQHQHHQQHGERRADQEESTKAAAATATPSHGTYKGGGGGRGEKTNPRYYYYNVYTGTFTSQPLKSRGE